LRPSPRTGGRSTPADQPVVEPRPGLRNGEDDLPLHRPAAVDDLLLGPSQAGHLGTPVPAQHRDRQRSAIRTKLRRKQCLCAHGACDGHGESVAWCSRGRFIPVEHAQIMPRMGRDPTERKLSTRLACPNPPYWECRQQRVEAPECSHKTRQRTTASKSAIRESEVAPVAGHRSNPRHRSFAAISVRKSCSGSITFSSTQEQSAFRRVTLERDSPRRHSGSARARR
jgi:hypothetical protein